MIIPVAVQSRHLIPLSILPPADPAGAEPRRDHRSIARISRHDVPRAAEGNASPYDLPARVSHYPSKAVINTDENVYGPTKDPARSQNHLVYTHLIICNHYPTLLSGSVGLAGICRTFMYRL